MINKRILIPFLLLAWATLACNAPLTTARPTIAPPPTLAPIRVDSAPIEDTVTPPSDSAETSLPAATFTPASQIAATATADASPTATASPTPTPTATIDYEVGGPLRFDYAIEWRVNPDENSQSIATVYITPRGGDGTYTYFRDELPIEGPVFEYRWGTCSGNPGSFRVTSGDGQSIKKDYFSSPPCP